MSERSVLSRVRRIPSGAEHGEFSSTGWTFRVCWFLFRYPFYPRVTGEVARKRLGPRSFCQKCRWQGTAWLNTRAPLRMSLCMKWHVPWLYGVGLSAVQNLRRDGSSFMWHQPCQLCKYTTSVDIQKRAVKSYSVTHVTVESHASAVSLLESGE